MSSWALCIRSSKVFDRWLISITDIPTPGSAIKSRCASSSTASGRTAGPAEKLNTRVAVGMKAAPFVQLNLNEVQIQDVQVAASDHLQQRCRRLTVEIDTGDGGLGALKHDVLGFLDVEIARAQVVEDMRQHAWTIAMTHDQPMCRGCRCCQIDNIWHLARLFVDAYDARCFGRNRLLGLLC